MSYIFGFDKLLTARGLTFGYPLPNETLQRNVLYLLSVHSSLVTFVEVDQRIWFNLDLDEVIVSMQLQHYSNQLVYLIVPFSLMAIITTMCSITEDKNGNATESLSQSNIQEYIYLRQLFSEEFICQRGVELMAS